MMLRYGEGAGRLGAIFSTNIQPKSSLKAAALVEMRMLPKSRSYFYPITNASRVARSSGTHVGPCFVGITPRPPCLS